MRPQPPTIPFHDLTNQPRDELPQDLVVRFHRFAEIFPMMTREEHDDLVTDIEKHGLREPIVKYEGKILDGRNRFVAALEAEVEITEVEYDGDDALEFVMSKNKHRRHLSEPQKHDVGAEYANLRRGRPQKGKPATLPILAKAIERDRVTQAEASKVMGVSERSIRAATVVHEKAIPAIRKRYKQGHVATHIAQKIARMPSEQQEEIAELPTKDIPGAVKKVQRAVKEKELGEATRKAAKRLGSALYNVIYADPPWRFEPRSRDTGMDRAADNHYPTLSLSDIIAIKVPAADDCVLFLWATVPMLPDALQLMESWDFDYRSHQVWDKQHIGTGYWFRNRHELLLVGTRGDMPAPAPGQQYESLISIQATRHSEKPFAFREMIDELYPTASKLEMFARGGDIAGWDRWGSEATEAEEAAD